MARRALIVGIDKYNGNVLKSLTTPSKDAAHLYELLSSSVDPQYDWRKVTMLPDLDSQDPASVPITGEVLWGELTDFFSPHGTPDDLLLYFAGHGINRYRTAVLATSETTETSGGIPMPDLMRLIQETGPETAASITVILDCCGSGVMNEISSSTQLPPNTGILTASFGNRDAYERTNDASVFSSILFDGLKGGAIQGVLGRISIASLVSFVHERFEEEDLKQRPTFHGYFTNVPVLRSANGALSEKDIDRLRVDFGDDPTHTITMRSTHEEPNLLNRTRGEDNSEEHKTEDQKQFDYFKRLQTAGLLAVKAEEQSLYWACGFDKNGHATGDPKDVYLTGQGQALWAVADRRQQRRDAVARRSAQ